MSPSSGKLPTRQEIHLAISSFSRRQKTALLSLGIIFIASLVGMIWITNDHFLVDVAVPGGTLTEGIVGSPSHVNPLFAITDPDRDVTSLVYSGLLKVGADGQLIPDLAESYSVSSGGLVYDFKLKSNLTWQDGTKLTADDIIFTIGKAQDPSVKSPRRAGWEGMHVEKINDHEVRFTLKKPYSGFLDNCTLGILPKHLWQAIKPEAFLLSDLNIKGTGSGPYRIVSITRDNTGLPNFYSLTAFAGYALGGPKITNLNLHFYDSDANIKTAFERGEIDSFGSIPPATALQLEQNGAKVIRIPLPRTFAVFFNQTQPALADISVRRALAMATDKKALVSDILKGAGVAIDNTIPPGSEGYIEQNPTKLDLAGAGALLTRAGWRKGADGIWQKTDKKKKVVRLTFNLATAATPELSGTANELASQWEKLGAEVTVSVYDLSDLDQNLIRPRKFDALLFGEVLGRDPDLYSFWHSSQRQAPGLNIAQYVSATADKLLEEARKEDDPEVRAGLDEKFQTELAKDTPAVFLYSPYFLYVLPSKVGGALFPSLLVPSERFSTISDWYINRDRVWKIFATK